MSVLTPTPLFQPGHHPLDEAAALCFISHFACAASDLDSGLKDLANSALRVPGLHKVQLEPSVAFPPLETFEWYASKRPVLCGSATAFVEAGGRSWGQLRLYFEPTIQTVESPLRFARFLGQQVALLLNRFALEDQRDAQLAVLEVLQRRWDTRFTVRRAVKIIAKSRGATENDALILLIRQARRSRRTLSSVADAIILGHASLRKASFRIPSGTAAFAHRALGSG